MDEHFSISVSRLQAVKLQVDAATHCQDKTSIEEYNLCYYDDVSSGCHIFKVQQAFLAGKPEVSKQHIDQSASYIEIM